MYYLKTTHIDYWDVDGFLSENFQDAIDNYHFVIESMMRRLPKEDWFNLQLWGREHQMILWIQRQRVLVIYLYDHGCIEVTKGGI